MSHPHDDQLLLFAYGELPDADAARVQQHLTTCATCRAHLAGLETPRVALDIALPPTRSRRLSVRWVAAGLAAAAVLAAVVLTDRAPSRPESQSWTPTSHWSATAGYVTGGRTMMEIDAQLTRLEQERYYGLPN
jgi:hypothetical protein